MEEIRVQPATFTSVSRTSPDAGRQRGQERRQRDQRRQPAPGAESPLRDWAEHADGQIRVRPVVRADGQVVTVRVYDARSGAYLGELSPDQLAAFAEHHQTYHGVLVERRL